MGYLNSLLEGGGGVDAVFFGTCLYVGATAFLREFQGSQLVRRALYV